MYIEVDAIYENVKQKNKEKDVDIWPPKITFTL